MNKISRFLSDKKVTILIGVIAFILAFDIHMSTLDVIGFLTTCMMMQLVYYWYVKYKEYKNGT